MKKVKVLLKWLNDKRESIFFSLRCLFFIARLIEFFKD